MAVCSLMKGADSCAVFLMGLMSLDITLPGAAQDHYHSVFTCIVYGCGFFCTEYGIMYVTHTLLYIYSCKRAHVYMS